MFTRAPQAQEFKNIEFYMMAAKSTTWSCLKRGWDNDLAFERASRSLAKTGLFGPPWRVKNHSVFDVFRRWRDKLGSLTCNFLMCLCTFWCHVGDFLMRILHFHSLFFRGCQNAFQGGLTCNFLMCLLHVWLDMSDFLMGLLHFLFLFFLRCPDGLQERFSVILGSFGSLLGALWESLGSLE